MTARPDVTNAGRQPSPYSDSMAEESNVRPLPLRDRAAVFRLVGPADIFAPLETPDEVICRVLRRGSLLLLAAYGSSTKTWQALDAAVAVATGDRWLHRFPCKRGRVTILDYESGAYELRRRIQLVARGRGLVGPAPDLDFATMPAGYLGERRFEVALAGLAAERDVIVIDSLKAASTTDENDSRIRRGLDGLRAIGERTGAGFVVLLHAKKTSGSQTAIDEREVLRGSSAIFDAADAVLVTTYRKAEGRFDVSQAKARHGRPVEPFAVRLVDTDGGVRVEGEDMPAPSATGSRADETAGRVRAVLEAHPGCGARALRKLAGGNAAETDRAVERLVRSGEAVDETTTRGKVTHHAYRLRGPTA